ncbi:MAG TPA: type VI secretion system baseplate subunit TssG [Syntrophorhabdales bacterium]|nr:type VI secretion system baseplate subunit TssG [Syntrophorhabdales bacterium]
MAGKDGDKAPTLRESLLSEAHQFSFVQAYRLLRLLVLGDSSTTAEQEEARIEIRPLLSPDAPDTGVVAISAWTSGGNEGYAISAPFPGLHEASSSLPAFYTEDLTREESTGQTQARDSLECLARPLYRLFFDAWAKYRLSYGIIEKGDNDAVERLLCLAGIPLPSLRERLTNPDSLLAALALSTQMPRSAEGLRIFLAKVLGEPTVRIEECVAQWVAIPEDQLLSLGARNHCLGQSAYCGSVIEDKSGRFDVIVGPVTHARFQAFLPDKPLFQDLREGIRYYLDQPLLWSLLISMGPPEIRTACLGEADAGRLGWNTWLSAEAQTRENGVVLWPQESSSSDPVR